MTEKDHKNEIGILLIEPICRAQNIRTRARNSQFKFTSTEFVSFHFSSHDHVLIFFATTLWRWGKKYVELDLVEH